MLREPPSAVPVPAPAQALRSKLVLPGILVAVDLAAKYLAWFLLRSGRQLALGKGPGAEGAPILVLGSVVNDTGSNALVDAMGPGMPKVLILSSAIYAALALVAILMNRGGAPRKARVLAYAGLVAAYVIATGPVSDPGFLPSFSPAPALVAFLRFAGGLVFGLAFLALTRDRIYARIWGLYVAGGAGNFLCLVLPPFGVIDFLNLPGLARGGNLYFNLADLYVLVFWIALVGWFLVRGIGRLPRPARKGGPASEPGEEP